MPLFPNDSHQIQWSTWPVTPFGPYVWAGNYYFIDLAASFPNHFKAKKSVDGGATWALAASHDIVGPGRDGPSSWGTCRSGSVLYIAFVQSNLLASAHLTIAAFDMSTDTWLADVTTNTGPNDAVNPFEESTQKFWIVKRSNGTYVILYSSNDPSGFSSAALTTYTGSWQPVQYNIFGTARDFSPSGLVLGKNDLCHIFGIDTASKLYHVSLDTGGNLSSIQTIDTTLPHITGYFSGPDQATVGLASYDSTSDTLAIPFARVNGATFKQSVAVGTSLASPVWSVGDVDAGANKPLRSIAKISAFATFPPAPSFTVYTNGALRVVWISGEETLNTKLLLATRTAGVWGGLQTLRDTGANFVIDVMGLNLTAQTMGIFWMEPGALSGGVYSTPYFIYFSSYTPSAALTTQYRVT